MAEKQNTNKLHKSNHSIAKKLEKQLLVLHINIQSLRNKTNELEAFIIETFPETSIICITEHWLKENEIDAYSINGFHIASKFCRSEFSHGGTLTLLKNSFVYCDLQLLNNLSTERHCEICAVRIKNPDVSIINLYRSPKGDFTIFMNKLEEILYLINTDSRIIICGDFNVQFNTAHPHSVSLCDLLQSFGFIQSITENTRGNNCLDNIFLNFSHDNFVAYSTEALLSDHMCQILRTTAPQANIQKDIRVCKPITELGINLFYNYIYEATWEYPVNATLDVNSKFNNFLNTILTAYHKAFPPRKICFKNNSPQATWFTDELKHMREHLQLLNEYCKINNTEQNKLVRNKFRLQYKSALKEAKISYNDKKIQQSSNPVKTMWGIINSQKNEKKTFNTLKKPNIDPMEFNEFFTSVANELIENLPKTNHNPLDYLNSHTNIPEFRFREVTYVEVRDIVNSLRNSQSKDIYGLNITLIKTIKDLIIIPLTKLINECLNAGIFPDALKIASVVPIFKKGEVDDVSNYRPISLLPIISKILEKVIKNQIVEYLESYNLFNKTQFGFRTKLSTTDAILNYTTYTLDCFERGMYSASIFCDLSKAFDCVSHELLLKKCTKYSFSQESIHLLKSYLNNRQQIVCFHNQNSEMLNVGTGVPQGSILGPVLFLIYINDLPNAVDNVNCLFYADDTTLSVSAENANELKIKLSEAQSNAEKWFSTNLLTLNKNKTVKMISSLKRDTDTLGENPKCVKFLGVYLDPVLKWDEHTNYIANIITRNIYVLRQMSTNLSKNVLKTAYFALIQSRLSYAILAWGHAAGRHRLLSLQRRAIRIVGGVGYRDDTSLIFQNYKILTLPCIYALECITYVKNNMPLYNRNKDYHNHLTRYNNDLRTNNIRLSRAQTGINSYGIKLFNALPNAIKSQPATKFRSTIKQYLIKYAFFTLEDIELGFKNFSVT